MRYGDDKKMRKALGSVTALTDSVVDDDLKAMAAAKRPAISVEVETEGEESEGAEGGLSPDEMETLKALLAKMQSKE